MYRKVGANSRRRKQLPHPLDGEKRLLKLLRHLKDGMNLQKMRQFQGIPLDPESIRVTETKERIQGHRMIEVLIA
jgi:hypothetical protein